MTASACAGVRAGGRRPRRESESEQARHRDVPGIRVRALLLPPGRVTRRRLQNNNNIICARVVLLAPPCPRLALLVFL